VSDISPSAIKVTPALEEALKNADASQIATIMQQARLDQNLVRPDWDPSFLIPVEPSAAPRKFARSITVDGQKRIVESDSELELERSIGDYFRALQGAQETNPARQQQQTIEQPRNERGEFVSAKDADRANQLEIVRRTELGLKFRRGEIDPATYLEESGAVADYLAKQGVPLEELKAQVAEKQSERFTQSWADATDEFLRSPAGADWPGGANREILGNLLAANPELIEQPSVETLSAVWEHMKTHGLAVENADVSYQRELSEARSPEQINAVNHKFFGSGLFNR
jgi:hypothetical protein